MFSKYCRECGALNQGANINFCVKCGNSFKTTRAKKPESSQTAPKPPPRRIEPEINNDDSEEAVDVPDIGELEYEIKGAEVSQGRVAIGSIMGTGQKSKSNRKGSQNKRQSKAEQKKVLEQIRKEAGYQNDKSNQRKRK